jgi:hypothetical protein
MSLRSRLARLEKTYGSPDGQAETYGSPDGQAEPTINPNEIIAIGRFM